MGNFSRDTFDRLKHYVGVRLQQGVPIVDADWNELEDVQKYELQTFLKWFVGDGVPQGNNGFEIFAVADSNDFGIRGGDGTPDGAGFILVEGWGVVNEGDLQFTEQALFNNADLAAEWGVDPVQPLTTPAANRTDLAYLDIWEREVDSTEDPDHLVNPAIGVETAVRLKREWAARVVEGSVARPIAPPGHVYYPLAEISRTGGNAFIASGNIDDQRHTGINLANLETNVAGIQAEVTAARGARPTLDQRLDQSIAENGQLRPNVVGDAQVPNGALSESKISFSGSGHNHVGGAQGQQIGAGGIADDAVTYDKINWQLVNSGTINNLAPGGAQAAMVDDSYDGKIYIPVITSVDVVGDAVADITAELVYRNLHSNTTDKFAVLINVASNSQTSNGNASVIWHVYTVAEA